MRILVSGASGFLGRYVVDRLLQQGHTVRAIIRPRAAKPEWPAEVEVFLADLRVHDNLASAFADVDAVLHLAAATSGGEDVQFASSVVATERFLEAMAQSTVKRIVHVSSLVVYDWSSAKGTMNEKTPLLTGNTVYQMGAYTIAKIWQEWVVARFAKTNSWDLTIMRPGFIWGPQRTSIAGMGRHFGKFYFMFGPLTRLPLSYVENCADCLVAAINNKAAVDETFNVIDGDGIRVWQYVREYARRTGQRGIFVPIPYQLGLGVARLAAWVSHLCFGERGRLPSLLTPRRFESQFKPLRHSDRKLRQLLNWTPPLSFDQCFGLAFHETEFGGRLGQDLRPTKPCNLEDARTEAPVPAAAVRSPAPTARFSKITPGPSSDEAGKNTPRL